MRNRKNDLGVCRCCVFRDICKRQMCAFIKMFLEGIKIKEWK